MNGMPRRIILQRIHENFFSLGVATIGHIDIGLGNRIDTFVGIDGRQVGLTEVSLDRRAGVHRLATG